MNGHTKIGQRKDTWTGSLRDWKTILSSKENWKILSGAKAVVFWRKLLLGSV